MSGEKLITSLILIACAAICVSVIIGLLNDDD